MKLIIVHASPGFGAFRMCFGTGASGSVAPLNALPDTDGLLALAAGSDENGSTW